MQPVDARKGYLFAAATVVLWAGFLPVSRLAGLSQLAFTDVAALRIGVSTALLLPLCRGLSWRYFLNWRCWLLGLLGNVLYGYFAYAGFNYAPASHAALLLPGVLPFTVTLAAWPVCGEKPRRQALAGLSLIALGVACMLPVYVLGRSGPDTLRGDGLFLAASTCWTLFTVLGRRWRFPAWDQTRFVALTAGVIYLPLYFFALPSRLSEAPWFDIILQGTYQGFVAALLAMVLFLNAVHHLGAARMSAFTALVPALGGTASMILLGEGVSGWILAGLGCVSLGAYVASSGASLSGMVARLWGLFIRA